MPIDFDFSLALQPLRSIASDGVVGRDVEPAWLTLKLFGRYDYAEGGGASPFFGVDEQTGAVLGLDVERTSPLFFVSSDIEAYVETFRLFDRAIRYGDVPTAELRTRLRAIDARVGDRDEWALLAEELAVDAPA